MNIFEERSSHQLMCGIVGIVSTSPVNQQIYDGLLLLQHRGQDSTGIATAEGNMFHMVKKKGQVREAYRTRNMRHLIGNMGLGHVRYATRGKASAEEEAQPFYVNAPYGIILVHNGNLVNTRELTRELYEIDRRHLNTTSDTEILLNVLANEMHHELQGTHFSPERLFNAVERVHRRIKGSYAVIAMIAGHGMLVFRDPHGIRPMIIGHRTDSKGRDEWIAASESLVLESGGYSDWQNVAPGGAVFIEQETGKIHRHKYEGEPVPYRPCAFEYVYLARPDSIVNGISVYEARQRLGETLADEIRRHVDPAEIDVVMPIPDSARASAMQVAESLGVTYREGFFKNHYVGRTFIMPGQAVRKKSVRQKLNAMGAEFRDKTVLIVDDSIVRGTTSREIVDMARAAGAKRVIFASAAPPVKYPHVYGINMPTTGELIAHGKTDAEVAEAMGADLMIYQTVAGMNEAILAGQTEISGLEECCFTGEYIAGDVGEEYLDWVEKNQAS